jgi:hypothetical protein
VVRLRLHVDDECSALVAGALDGYKGDEEEGRR